MPGGSSLAGSSAGAGHARVSVTDRRSEACTQPDFHSPENRAANRDLPVQAGPLLETPSTVGREAQPTEAAWREYASAAAAGKAKSLAKRNSLFRNGSRLGFPLAAATMSNDPEDGGRFIRSGPDGMGGMIRPERNAVEAALETSNVCMRRVIGQLTEGARVLAGAGTVTVCVQAHDAGAAAVGSTRNRPLVATSTRTSGNPLAAAGGAAAKSGGAKRSHSMLAGAKGYAVSHAAPNKRGRDISSFFARSGAPGSET